MKFSSVKSVCCTKLTTNHSQRPRSCFHGVSHGKMRAERMGYVFCQLEPETVKDVLLVGGMRGAPVFTAGSRKR